MHSVTIAVVEDDDGHARLIKKNLRRANINNALERFKNGRVFLEYLESDKARGRHHLVLLDLNMPELDGYEVLKRMKVDERFKRIPVIILTTTDDPREIERCYEAGCNVYITKPVEYTKFSDAIRELGLLLNVMAVP